MTNISSYTYKMRGIIQRFLGVGTLSLLALVIQFCLTLFLARYFSVDDFGSITLLITVVTVSSVFSKFGLQPTILRFGSEYKMVNDDARIQTLIIYSTIIILLLSIFVSIFSHIVFVPSTRTNLSNPSVSVHIIWMMVFSISLNGVTSSIYRFQKMLYLAATATRLVSQVSYILSLLFVITFFENPTVSTYINTAASLLLTSSVLLFFRCLAKLDFSNKLYWDLSLIGKWNSIALTLFPTVLIQVLLRQVDLLVVGITLSPFEIGLYAFGAKLSEVVSVSVAILNLIYGVRFAELKIRGKHKELRQLVNRLLFVNIISYIIFAASLLILTFIVLYDNSEIYRLSLNVLVILLIGKFFFVATGAFTTLLMLTGNQKSAARNSALSLIISIVSCIIFIHIYGYVGAAIASSLSLSVMALLNFRSVNILFGENILRDFVKDNMSFFRH